MQGLKNREGMVDGDIIGSKKKQCNSHLRCHAVSQAGRIAPGPGVFSEPEPECDRGGREFRGAVDPGKTGEDAGGGAAEGGGGWDSWNTLRQACEHHQLLGVALKLPVELLPGAERFSQRWLGEPVRAVLLPTRCFRPNKRGFPTLPPAYQTLLSQALAVGIQVILTGAAYIRAPAPERPAGASGGGVPEAMEGKVVVRATEQGGAEVGRSHPLLPYMEYLAWLFRKLPVAQGQESMEVRYRDYLQMPLQPLQDNLESLTYETFERDSIKYVKYEEAVLAALRDRQAARPPSDKPVVIMVVGAGRGPLVKASLSAAERCGCPVKVWAVEKNSNAVVTLQHRSKDEDWQGRVTIVCADMRTWAPQEKADILVSELLGSFGDNELCPECLDGAQRFLKEEGGVSIPCEYTSYLAPITAAKLYTDVKSHAELKHFETPYVVKLCRFAPLAPPQRVFRFTHPNRTLPIDNTREASLRFRQDAGPGNMMCHGFAGYFDTVLYGDIRLSTHPDTHTPDMHSWFPIFFPLRMPVFLPPDSTLEVHMTREVAAHKVWYEWWVSQPCLIPVHNPGGRSYYVGL